jgi:uncharacterized protein (TIGR02246 family)
MESGAPLVSPSDEQTIQAVVKAYEACWNRHDMAALAELFADDAHWVNIVGMYWPGKSAAVAGHEWIHRTFFQTTEMKVLNVAVRAIAPGVAVAVVQTKMGAFTPPDGVCRPEAENRMSFVLAQRNGRWQIAHGHNTVIDPVAQPFDAVKRGSPRQDR